MRSVLFVPAHRYNYFAKAIATAPDIIVFDLEDSVPAGQSKIDARENIARLLKESGEEIQSQVYVRINDIDSNLMFDELEFFVGTAVDGFMVPKSYRAEDVETVAKMLTTFERRKGWDRPYKLMPLIETADSVVNVHEIARASDRVMGLALGSEDLLAALGAVASPHYYNVIDHARFSMLLACRAAGIIAIDTVYIAVHDFDGFKTVVTKTKEYGLDGVLCLNPQQVQIANDILTPSDEEYDAALAILKVGEDTSDGTPVKMADKKFIGPPIILQAKRVVEKYERYKGSKNG